MRRFDRLVVASAWLAIPASVEAASRRDDAAELRDRDPMARRAGFTIEEALVLMRRDHPLVRVATSVAATAEADAVAAGLWQNPTLQAQYSRSTGFTTYDPDLGYGEFSIAQRLELTGAPSIRRRSGRRVAAAARTDIEALRVELGITVILAAIELRAAIARLAVLQATAAALGEAERIMVARVDAGAAPAYHATRMHLAAAQATADAESGRAEVELARAALAGAVGPGFVELRGDPAIELDRAFPIPVEHRGDVVARGHPGVRANRLRAEAARLGVSATRRSVWPGLQISFGIAFGGGYDPARARSQLDVVGGLVVPIPVLDRGQGAIPAARARARTAEERTRDFASAVAIPLSSLERSARARRRAARDFEARTRPRADVVVQEATDGYRDGKLTILELVDAYESARDIALRRVDLAASARASELELWRRHGRLPP